MAPNWEGPKYLATKTPTNRLYDPFQLNFVNVRWNPFYHINMTYTTWRYKRNERAKSELQTINLTILLLQEKKTVSDNKEEVANYKNQIEYWTNESNRLQAQINNYEEDD